MNMDYVWAIGMCGVALSLLTLMFGLWAGQRSAYNHVARLEQEREELEHTQRVWAAYINAIKEGKNG